MAAALPEGSGPASLPQQLRRAADQLLAVLQVRARWPHAGMHFKHESFERLHWNTDNPHDGFPV